MKNKSLTGLFCGVAGVAMTVASSGCVADVSGDLAQMSDSIIARNFIDAGAMKPVARYHSLEREGDEALIGRKTVYEFHYSSEPQQVGNDNIFIGYDARTKCRDERFLYVFGNASCKLSVQKNVFQKDADGNLKALAAVADKPASP